MTDHAKPPRDNAEPPDGDLSRPTSVRWIIFALASATSFVLYLHRYTWGFVKADVRSEFGWSEWQLGMLDGLFNASYAFGQVPAGILCDWFGPHMLLSAIIVLWSLAMGGVTIAGGLYSMASARILFGLTQAGCYPILGKVTKLWFPLSVRTSVQGWIATFFGRSGGAVAFVVVGTVLMGQLQLSWRGSVVLLTIVGVAFGVLFAFLFRNTPEDHPLANDAEIALITEGRPERSRATRTAVNWRGVFQSRNMRFLFVQQFTSAYADNVFVYWIPLFLLTVKQVDVKSAGWMSALPLIGGAVGGMVGATLQNHLILRTGRRRWTRSLIGLGGKLVATVLMFVSLGFESAVAIVWLFAALKFFGDWTQPTVWGTVTDIAGRNPASVFAAVNTVGSIAAFIAGPTMGLIIMVFSDTALVQQETADAVAVSEVSAEFRFARADIVGPVTGSLYRDGSLLGTFAIGESDEFSFNPARRMDATSSPPSASLDGIRGRLSLVWDGPSPAVDFIVVDYTYREYGGGWAALFTVIGVIYLVSALSWLFIDCTLPIAGEEEG